MKALLTSVAVMAMAASAAAQTSASSPATASGTATASAPASQAATTPARVRSALRLQSLPARAHSHVVPEGTAMRELWRESLRALATAPADSAELDDAIDRLRATDLHRRRKAKPLAVQQPDIVLPPPPRIPEPKTPATAPALSEKEIQRLRKLTAVQLTNAAQLGEALLAAGKGELAYEFFDKALNREKDADEQAWLLLQMARCKKADVDAARALYKQVVSKHPDSRWATVAAAQDKLLGWYQENDVQALLEWPVTQEVPDSETASK